METWQWASQITNSYVFPRWPLPSEIAAQYMLLLLLEMQANHALKLPYRAAEQQPESVSLRLTARQSFPLLEQKKESNDGPESAATLGDCTLVGSENTTAAQEGFSHAVFRHLQRRCPVERQHQAVHAAPAIVVDDDRGRSSNIEYGYLEGRWEKGEASQVAALLTRKQFDAFVEKLGLVAEDVQTMGSLALRGSDSAGRPPSASTATTRTPS